MPAGRPKFTINYNAVTKLATIHCTEEEIASVLGCSIRTLQRDKEFCRVYKRAIESGKASLRRHQWEAAKKGNPTMLIWLGKQLLGQWDKQTHEHSGPGGNPVQIQAHNEHVFKLSDAALELLEQLGAGEAINSSKRGTKTPGA